jgi:hypothetical protein
MPLLLGVVFCGVLARGVLQMFYASMVIFHVRY